MTILFRQKIAAPVLRRRKFVAMYDVWHVFVWLGHGYLYFDTCSWPKGIYYCQVCGCWTLFLCGDGFSASSLLCVMDVGSARPLRSTTPGIINSETEPFFPFLLTTQCPIPTLCYTT